MKKMVLIFLLILVGLGFIGCASTRTIKTGTPSLQTEKYDQIEKGETTKTDILHIFGAPESKTTKHDGLGEMWEYIYSEIEVKTSFSPLLFIPTKSEFRGEKRTLCITFDRDGVVLDYYVSEKEIFQPQWEEGEE